MFEIDYKLAQDFGNVADGTYEVYIKDAKQDATKNGSDFIDIQFKIREDFDQPHKNMMIFNKVFAKKETGKYNPGQIMNLAKAAGIPDGTKFASLDDYLTQLTGKSLKVTVKNEKSEHNGTTYENLNVKRMEVSALPPVAGAEPVQVADEDLPF